MKSWFDIIMMDWSLIWILFSEHQGSGNQEIMDCSVIVMLNVLFFTLFGVKQTGHA